MKKLNEAKLEMYRQESAEELYNFVKDYLEKNHPDIWDDIFHSLLADFRKDIEEIKDAIKRGKESK